MSSLTPKQKKILDFIASFEGKRGYAPSQREIADHFGFSSLGTIQNYLVRLERQGALAKRDWNAKRGLQPVPPPQPHTREGISGATLPLLGRVAAGKPIEAIQTEETLEVPASLLSNTNFVLKVMGDSMIEDGILNGDYIVVKKRAHAQNGETVVALVNNEATVKRFYKKGQVIELRPANEAYKSLFVESLVDDFRIEGVVVGVIRHL